MATKRQSDLRNSMDKIRGRVAVENQKEAVETAKRKLQVMRSEFRKKHPVKRRGKA